jgi:uncharacterized membrane protein
MEALEKLFQGMQLHPVADHYTVALLTVAIVIDLIAGLFPARGWLRATALTLTIVGALAAAASYATGDMETDRIWEQMSPQAQAYFKSGALHLRYLGHGALGYELMFVFGALAVWRIMTALLSFMEGTRGLYLLVAVISLGFLTYQGHTGGELVYYYGVGTGAMAAGATPQPTPAPELPSTELPPVYVPPDTSVPGAAASAEATPVANPPPTAPSSGGTSEVPSAGPSAKPDAGASPAAGATPAIGATPTSRSKSDETYM